MLGVAAVITTSVIGIAVAFLLIRYDFPGRNLFSYLTMLPMILPPLVGVLGFVFILGRAGTVNVLLMDWFGMEHADQLHVRHARRAAGRDGAPVSADDAQHPRCAVQGRSRRWRRRRRAWARTAGAGSGTSRCRSPRPATFPGALLVFIWTFADFVTPLVARRAGPARPAGLPQHRAVRRPAHLPHGHRDLGAAGAARHRVRAGGAPVRGDQGLQLARLLEGRAPAAGAGEALAGGGLPVAAAVRLVHPAGRRAARRGRAGAGRSRRSRSHYTLEFFGR